jgi:ATP-binding cassette subfamily B protein
MIINKYKCVRQRDITDCGAACLATISMHYGLKKSVVSIRDMAGTDTGGTTALGLVEAARKMGFSAKGVRGTIDQLDSNIPYPAIAHVKKEGYLHFVVVHKVKKKTLILADPSEGVIEMTKEDFAATWSGVLILMIPDVSFVKGNEVKGIGRFVSILSPHKKLIAEITFASLLFTFFGICGAFYFKFLLDDVLTTGLESTLHVISVGMVILIVFRVLLNAFRRHILLYMGQKIDIMLIFSYYRHVLSLPMKFFDTRKTGEILSRLEDKSKIRATVSSAAFSVLIDTLMVAAGGVVLFIQNSNLFFVTLAVIPFSILIVWLFTKPFERIQRRQMSQAAETEAYLVESLSGITTIKALNARDEASLETETRFVKYLRSLFKGSWMQNLQFSLQDLVTLIAGLVILWVGGLEVMKGDMTIGQLITFNALLAYFYTPIQNLINLQPQLIEAFVAQERLVEILDVKPEADGEDDLIEPVILEGDIRYENITFCYKSGEPVLNDITFRVSKGEIVALVGESGSGKSTLAKLLLKYYRQDKGDIYSGDINIRDMKTEALRERIGYVPQDIFLYSGTVRDNIAFGNKGATFSEIIEASCNAMAHEFINAMPLRYDTMIGERGSTISGGQKQRIALARVFLKKPDIIILDEATSHLDNLTEKAIHGVIEKLGGKTTVIIIAHRLTTIMKSSRIIVLDKGRIVETGSHDELMKLQGKYFGFWGSGKNSEENP